MRLEKAESRREYGAYYTVWKDITNDVKFTVSSTTDDGDDFEHNDNCVALIPEEVRKHVPAGYHSILSRMYQRMVETEFEVDERQNPTLSWPFWHTDFWNSASVLERFQYGACATDESSLWAMLPCLIFTGTTTQRFLCGLGRTRLCRGTEYSHTSSFDRYCDTAIKRN